MHRSPVTAAGFALLLFVVLVLACPVVSGCRAASEPETYAGPWFDLVYAPGEFSRGPEAAAVTIDRVATQAALLVGSRPPREWAFPAGKTRPVFVTPGAAELAHVSGTARVDVPGTSEPELAEAAATAVLYEALSVRDVDPAVAAGLGTLADLGSGRVDAEAIVLLDRERLASIPQLFAWWPSLPFGREQLASLVAYLLAAHGGGGVLTLARVSSERYSYGQDPYFGWLGGRVLAATGEDMSSVDPTWVTSLKERRGYMGQDVLAPAAAEVSRGLDRVRWTVVGLGAAAMAAFAALLLVLLRRGRPMAFAVLAAGLAGLTELVVSSAGPWLDVKLGVAVGGTALFAAGLGWWVKRNRRAGPPAGAREAGTAEPEENSLLPSGRPAGVKPAAESAEPEMVLLPAARKARGPAPWLVALAAATLMFLIIMAPRLGLYFYWRQIWGKATMIVFVLALVFMVEKNGLDSVGLGKISFGRFVLLAAAGIVAYRGASFLTDLTYYGIYADVTRPWFVLESYEPYWKLVAFHHSPFAPWPGWLAAVDIADFFFGNFAEELFFRGYLLTRLAKTMGWWKAAFAQALLFGLFHVNYDMFPVSAWPMFFYIVSSGLFGLMMALLLRGTKTLLVPALVHPMYNLGLLAVGVSFVNFRGDLTSYFSYYLIELGVGIVVIPTVLHLLTGEFRRTGWPGLLGRLRRPRKPKGPYIEVSA